MRLRAGLVALVGVAALAVPANPASAHGACTNTVSDYTLYAGTFSWYGRIRCTSSHYNYYIRACLMYAEQPLLAPINPAFGFWEVSCAEATTPGPATTLRVDGTWDPDVCQPGYYQTYAVGSATNNGDHWGVPYAYGPIHFESCT